MASCPRAVWLLVCAAVLAAPASSRAQSEPKYSGIPYYQFYSESAFGGAAKANFIVTSENGTLVYGNEHQIHTFDGNSWDLLALHNISQPKIASIYWSDGEIYAGSFQTVGVLRRDESNRIAFQPFAHGALEQEALENYADILPWEGHIVFKGARGIALYNKASREVKSYSREAWVTAVFTQGRDLYVADNARGISRYNGEGFDLVSPYSPFTDKRTIVAAQTAADGRAVLITDSDGLYAFDGQTFMRAYPYFSDYEGFQATDLALFPDGRAAVSLSGKGIVILLPDGTEDIALDGKVDYRFKSARQLKLDQHGVLWAMFSSTIARILPDLEVMSIDERLRPSLFYGSLAYSQGELYLRNGGILSRAELDRHNRLAGFENCFPGAPFQVTHAAVGTEGVYFLSNLGIHLLSDNIQTKLIDFPNLDRLAELKSDPRYLLATDSAWIRLFRKEGQTLVLADSIANPGGFVNKLIEDDQGNLWFEHGLGLLSKVNRIGERLSARAYTTADGLPPGWVAAWDNQGQALFTEVSGLFAYNPSTDRFERHGLLDPYFTPDELHIHRAATDPEGNLWLSISNQNAILWKQPDGTYRVDTRSLKPMGELFFDSILFLPNGDALIMTAQELFSYDHAKAAVLTQTQREAPKLLRITNLDSGQPHYTSLGDNTAIPALKLPIGSNSLSFSVSTTFTPAARGARYRYRLEGFSKDWSEWTASNQFHFTNISPGDHQLRVQAELGNGEVTPELRYTFAILPPFYQTPAAHALFVLAGGGLIWLCLYLYSRRLKYQNLKLERMVQDRTKEIEAKNLELEAQAEVLEEKNYELALQSEELQRNTGELASALIQLRNTQDQLMHSARKAGMAEVATNVLHNVGNVLNSINIGIVNLANKLAASRVGRLRKVADLLGAHRPGLAHFMAHDPRGRAVPDYLEQLAKVMEGEFESFTNEALAAKSNIDHVKRIIANQQTHAKSSDVIQLIDVAEVVSSALSMIIGENERSAYEVVTRIEPDLAIESDKHKILQMLANFIKNAKEAIRDASVERGLIRIDARLDPDADGVTIRIADNGIGIDADSMDKVFVHGFTTKDDGHGFGMHSCANTVKTLGGELRIESPGLGKGATVTLKLPQAAHVANARPPQTEAAAR